MELLQDAGTQLELETKTTHMIQGWESSTVTPLVKERPKSMKRIAYRTKY